MALCRLILLFLRFPFSYLHLTPVKVMLIRFTRFVWRSVRKVGAWGKGAFNTVNSLLMGKQLSPFIRNGSSGTVVPIVGTTVCLLERNRERNSVTNRSNIMENGLFDVSMGSRDVELTEKLDYISAVVLVGFSLILAILRAFKVRDEASRVMAAAPLIAFVTTHILYLNFYKLDYGLYMKACMKMGVVQLLFWGVWAGVTSHPSRWKVWLFVVGGSLAVLLEIYDFPPYRGFVDAHALWHAARIPLTYIFWSFVREDAEFRTSTLLKKMK